MALTAPVWLCGCDIDPPSAATPRTLTPEPDPDAEVVAAARTATLLMVANVASAASAHPRLGPDLAPWLDLHAAHLEVLDDGTPEPLVEAPLPAPRAAVARQRLLSAEGALAGTLADAARQAASGDLARVLASMSAAVTQRLVP